MNKEVIKNWVAALRSGEYKQGFDRLKYCYGTYCSYCCLGVLCDLAVKEGVLSEGVTALDLPAFGEEDETHVLPEEVKTWAELDSYNPVIGEFSLAQHNDCYGKTFDELADMIEEEYLSE